MAAMRVLLAGVVVLSLATVVEAASPAWVTDIDYLAKELPKRHPNLFHDLSSADFDSAIASLKVQVGSLSTVDVVIHLQEIVASLRDAHTEVDTRIGPMTFFPLRLYEFSDGFFVTRTNDAARAACGKRVVAIDGMPVDEVYKRVSRVISAENDAWLLARVPLQMSRAEVLAAVGVIHQSGVATFTFELSPDVTFDMTLSAVSASEASSILSAPYSGPDLPLYLQQPQRNYWYTWDADRRLLYLKYNLCANDPNRSFQSVANELYAIVQQTDVAAFVIDLRNNVGGSDAVLRPLIDALPGVPQLQGRVYAIIGRETFSSGMLNAVQLRDAGAILVGEETGGKPNSYGEVRSMQLPNSGVSVYYSTKFIQASVTTGDSLVPAIPVALSSDDFFARRDPVLDFIVERTVHPAADAIGSTRHRAVRWPAARICPQ